MVAASAELGFSGKGVLGFSGVGGGPIGTVVFDVEGSASEVVEVVEVAGALGGGGPMVVVIGRRAGGEGISVCDLNFCDRK